MNLTTMFIVKTLYFYSMFYGMDPSLVIAVAMYESKLDHTVVGPCKELGVMQLLPSSYPNYTKKQLKDVETNIKLGVKYLHDMQYSCKHKKDTTWILCYNRGPTGGARVKYPKKDKYYQEVMKIYRELGGR